MAGLAVESVDDALHFDREIDGAPDVVEARHAQSAAGQVAVVQRPDLLDAEILRSGVELAVSLLTIASSSSEFKLGGQLVEADDVGEDHRDVLVVLRDRLLALAIALHDGFGHQRQQQAIVLPPLLGEQFLLDRQVAAHVVESDCQIAEFVAGPHGQRDVVVAAS